MTNTTIRIGSRGSQLALWQANHVASLLRANGHAVEITIIKTIGDRMQDPAYVAPATFPDGSPLDGKGIFIKEIEIALAEGHIDLAVHSLKDLPTQLDPRFTLAAIPPRADARDAFVCEEHWGLHMMPAGARVATTSPRRQAMLLALRPDLEFVAMRGNIDTRLRKWSEGQCDALVLASAGLDRLEQTAHVHQRFAVDELTPAPGQGALALQTRCPRSEPIPHSFSLVSESKERIPQGFSFASESQERVPQGFSLASESRVRVPQGFSLGSHGGQEKEGALAPEDARDAAIHAAVRALNCPATEFAVTAERTVLNSLGGGCQLPLGAFCSTVSNEHHLHAMVVSPDGEQVIHIHHRAPLNTPAADLGRSVAEALLARGAMDLLQPTA